MNQQFFKFIKENNLSPFSNSKAIIRGETDSIFKTRDAKAINQKVLSKIASNFCFYDTSALFQCFSFTLDADEIKKRQDFFKSIQTKDRSYLKKIAVPKKCWRPKYDLIAVTENEETFIRLNELGCLAKLLISENDLNELEKYDLVQVIDCDEFSRFLERLPQTVFIDSASDAYLERYLEVLSAWLENIELLEKYDLEDELKEIIAELKPLFLLMEKKKSSILSREHVFNKLEEINDNISKKIKEMTISGDSLLKIVNEGKLPPEFKKIVDDSVKEAGLPFSIININIPVTIDEKELDSLIKKQDANEFTNIAELIKSYSKQLKAVPEKLEKISSLLLIFDFFSGILKFKSEFESYPEVCDLIEINNSKNIFLENAQPISFGIDINNRCSILTGANSGGKTTLIEHIIQLISLTQLGLSASGKIKMPLFSEVYYFAKNKGSMNKGAFETLLTQMSKIKPGRKTLILADEIESVTEPGVAGKIICATSDYFIKKECFLVIATHLGQEIIKNLPKYARVDGIEAKGLDENFELIVDHNPVIGRLAHSTPELIVERLASSDSCEYFSYVYEFLKNNFEKK
ncbi:MAG: hypothetical protein Q7S33_04800 [Nanoarchaeota archaeon]|nr:hypothetical protein [Nanoarchaeota archaeon]